MKIVCTTAVCLALLYANCMGQNIQKDGLSQLCEIYRRATATLNKVKTIDESNSAMDTLSLLLRSNMDNMAIKEVLRWSYDTCPKEKPMKWH